MATVGSLIVNLVANTGLFHSGMTKAGRSLHAFEQTAHAARRTMHLLQGALAVAGVSIGVGWVKGIMEGIDVSAKLADRVGMSVEALKAYSQAANLAGVNNETLAKGLEVFLRKVSEAKSGTGDAADAIAELGLGAKDLAAMQPEKAFELVASRMQAIEDEGDKLRLTFALFGKGGASFTNLFADGADNLGKLREELGKVQNAYSRIDARKVEEANDAIERMQMAMKSIGETAVIAIAPAIEAAATAMTELIKSGNQVDVITNGFEQLAIVLAKVSDLGSTFKVGVAGISKVGGFGLSSLLVNRDWADKTLKAGASSNENATRQWFEDLRAKQSAQGKAAHFASVQGGYTGAVDTPAARAQRAGMFGIGAQMDTAASFIIKRTKGGGGGGAEDILGSADAQEKYNRMVEATVRIYEEGRSPAEKFRDELGAMDELLQQGLSWENYAKGVQGLYSTLKGDLSSTHKPQGEFSVVKSATLDVLGLSQMQAKQDPVLGEAKKTVEQLIKVNENLAALKNTGGLK